MNIGSRDAGERHLLPRSLLCLLAVLMPVCCVAADPPPLDLPASNGDNGPVAGIDYRVEFEGALLGGRQGDLLRASSQLLSLADRPPASVSALARRAEGDLRRLTAVLRSEGYYDGEVDFRLDEELTPVLVTLVIERGDPYLIKEYEIVYTGDVDHSGLPADPAELGVELGRRARGSMIVAAEGKLLTLLAQRGHPLAEIDSARHELDRGARALRSRVTVSPGPAVGFGPLTFSGLVDVDEAYMQRIPPFDTGQPYDRRLIDDFRQDLLDTRLFSAVAIEPADRPDGDGNLPLTITLAERDFRTVGGGLSWGTDEGWELTAFWEHRNFFHQNERLRAETRLGKIEKSLNAFIAKPRFRRQDQTLLADARLKRIETDAYKETNITGAIGLERELGPLWDGKLGVTGELSDITENEEDTALLLVGLPGSLIRDSRDDDLDPTRGSRLALAVTPYVTTGDNEFVFFVTDVSASTYLSLHREDKVVLAGRTRVGSIIGESRAEIPAPKRFYAGGGGSIRGYQFQKVGPLDDENDPLGGRSRLEVSVELRLRLTENLGVVPFVDGGTVFTEPDFRSEEDETIRWAAGLGFRYFTLIGPLRVDFAVPLNQRSRIDDDFQFYVSIGQAF